MKLERTLIELSTLVEYGTKYLVERSWLTSADHYEDIGTQYADMLSLGEFMELKDLSDYDLMDYVDSNNLKDYACANFGMDEIYDEYDIKDYVKDNFDMEDVYDDDYLEDRARDMVDDMSLNEILDIKGMGDTDILNTIDAKALYDYVTSNFALADWVQWKDECTSYVNG